MGSSVVSVKTEELYKNHLASYTIKTNQQDIHLLKYQHADAATMFITKQRNISTVAKNLIFSYNLKCLQSQHLLLCRMVLPFTYSNYIQRLTLTRILHSVTVGWS